MNPIVGERKHANSPGSTAFIAVDEAVPDEGNLDWIKTGEGFSIFTDDCSVGVVTGFGVVRKPSVAVGPKETRIPIRDIADKHLMVRLLLYSLTIVMLLCKRLSVDALSHC